MFVREGWTMTPSRASLFGAVLVSALLALEPTPGHAADSFVGPFSTISTIASTVPRNGDVNPYGVAVVPVSSGDLIQGNVLVSNFNNRRNLQGTGSTIVQIAPGGAVRVFAEIDANRLPGACPGGIGLTTALVALRSGWVIVGSLPTRDGTSATMQAGCLLVLNSEGRVVETFAGGAINGPWDMTAVEVRGDERRGEQGDAVTLFVTNVLNGTVAASPNVVAGGTVVRISLSIPAGRPPAMTQQIVIGQGFGERTDPAALVVGPTGLGLGGAGTLYIADSVGNRIAAIGDALSRTTPTTGRTVSAGMALNDPLGLAIAPNGDILTVNGGDGNLVETTPAGIQVATKTLDTTPAPPGPPGNGTLFGLAVAPGNSGVYFVDDGDNTLKLLH
jgi:hypothetical protein